MKNAKEFIALVERYESITLDEIKEAWDPIPGFCEDVGLHNAKLLTGFGTQKTCTLCNALENPCMDCVYGESYGCISNHNSDSYWDIEGAKTPIKLKNAFRRRAKHLRKNYKHIFNGKNITTD